MALSFDEAIDQLSDRSSAKRRQAAKRLRVLCDDAAGPALYEAIQAEVRDPRTWETQYQMIMALGACNYSPAAELLVELASKQDGYRMVGVAVGDALTRIEWETSKTLAVVERSMTDWSTAVADGAFRALAMLHIVPSDELVERVIAFAKKTPSHDPLRYWVVAAAAGWESPSTNRFLRSCKRSINSELAELAKTSLAGTYVRHSIL